MLEFEHSTYWNIGFRTPIRIFKYSIIYVSRLIVNVKKCNEHRSIVK